MLIQNADIEMFCDSLRRAGAKIVFTNGCFDILHAGHVRYLQQAKRLGDYLIVGLNSDASVSRLKGENRPINGEADRAEVLAGLSAVDFVVVFPEATAAEIISRIKPAVYVKGGDYSVATLPEAPIVQEYGGEIAFIDVVEGRSTTNVVEKIKNSI